MNLKIKLSAFDIFKDIFNNTPRTILISPPAKGKSYSLFFIKYNLMGLEEGQIITKLKELLESNSLEKSDISFAKMLINEHDTKK